MTDTEKIQLIGRIIADYWEFNAEQDMRDGAVAIVTAICSVVDFKED